MTRGLPGAETTWNLAARVYAALTRILTSDARHQVIVTHGMAATFLLVAWIEMPLDSAGRVAFRVRGMNWRELLRSAAHPRIKLSAPG
jgi:broad specificity phosphatase PhoE